LQDERKLHLSAAEELAYDLHAFEQDVIDDFDAEYFSSAVRSSSSRPIFSPSMMRFLRRSSTVSLYSPSGRFGLNTSKSFVNSPSGS
jgi:hypothetical protein